MRQDEQDGSDFSGVLEVWRFGISDLRLESWRPGGLAFRVFLIFSNDLYSMLESRKMNYLVRTIMTTIPIEVSTEQLIHAVQQLPSQELERFIAQIVALRAQRSAPSLSQEETILLNQINTHLTPISQQRLQALVAKRQEETIKAEELIELIQLTDTIEHQDATRLAALIELAKLRQTTLASLMKSLGLRPASHA